MYSNLIKADYEIKDVKLQELRDRIVSENNLTPLDILKGFHEKSTIELKYKSCLSEQNIKDCISIEEEHKRYISEELGKTIQGKYDAEFNKAFNDCKEHCPEITLDDIIRYENNDKKNASVAVQNACFHFTRTVSRLRDSLREQILNESKAYIIDYIEKTFGGLYAVNLDNRFCDFVGLPSKLDTNMPIDIDFSKVYECYKDNFGSFADSSLIDFSYDNHIGGTGTIKFYINDVVNVFTHLSELQAKSAFDNAINDGIYQDNSIGEIEYLQNLEAQPITININTKTNKYELIDGYKRLLYITDKKLLGYTAPVKFFIDLNDAQFLALLYSANIWKTEKNFHDRGFLFALKSKYNFTIPLSTYENKSWYFEELGTLQLYDFGENLNNVGKTELMNGLLRHKFLVNDMQLMYNFLPKEAAKQPYDKNMSEEIMFSIIELVGKLRRNVGNNMQNDISEELITSIFEDGLIKKSCSKKHLSTRTYVINYFRDKGLYKRIEEMLKNSLIK